MEADAAIDPRAARGFRDVADVYERGRPGYPREALAEVLADLEVPPSPTVIDLAAGTGKLTRVLVDLGCKVVAVEPLDGMRRKLAEVVPDAVALDGTAESLPVADQSADAVLVGQAFHWFRVQEAAREIARALRPGGGLVVLWNIARGGDSEEPWQRDASQVLERHGLGETSPARQFPSGNRTWRIGLAESGLFEPIHDRVVPNTQELTADELMAQFSSWSWIAGLPDEPRAAVLDDIRDVLVANGFRGSRLVTVRHRLEISWTRKVAGA